MDNIKIRLEEKSDYREVETLTKQAFWNIHVPGCDEHYLVHVLRDCPAFIPQLDLVMELNGKIIGHIIYTKAKIVNEGQEKEVLTFGPVSIHPDYQGLGYGSKLINHSLGKAKELGYKLLVIYGDPDYYRRFAFLSGEDYDIYSSDGYYNPALQVLELEESALDNISGSFHEDKTFAIDEEAAKAFDKDFPFMEKKNTPSQVKFMNIISKRKKRLK
jgi:predicted N-acetyltransferase YhbS